MTVIEYVTEEVERQGHDVSAIDGLERVSWMLEAWVYALRLSDLSTTRKRVYGPSLADAEVMGKMIERVDNARGWRRCHVMVGSRACPDYLKVPALLVDLFEVRGPSLSPLEFYKAFASIHPFVDGNGRTGKVLLNWLGGTLRAPVFPPADLWGRALRNP